jgi:DNA-3-methyladenine glycosylase
MTDSHSLTAPAHIRPLPRSFYSRDPRRVARELLGKVLVRDGPRNRTARIVEVEAYLGEKDPASHSAAGNTARTSVLFGPPGHAYVYFIYGTHYCLNVSCEPAGQAGGVLFRALEPLTGMEEMARDRGLEIHGPSNHGLKNFGLNISGSNIKDLIKLTSGPGRLSEAFAITRARDNGCDLTSAASSLWIGEETGDDAYRARGIRTSPRIGITKAVDKPWRYFLGGNPFVSRVHAK